MYQKWARIRSPATFFGSGFEFLGKTGAGFDMYRMIYKHGKDGHAAGSESKIWRRNGFGVLDVGSGSRVSFFDSAHLCHVL